MAYEASEIMTAVALQYTTKALKSIETVDDLKTMIEFGKKNIKKLNIQFGSDPIKNGFLANLDSTKDKKIEDMAVGVSAAIATRKFIGSPTGKVTVYMTGNKWPKEVEDFQVNAYGFKDYNSSDIVVRSGTKNTFYGISLKKKKTVKAADPTLINKAFSTVFDGDKYKELKEKLIKTRTNYFAKVVDDAVKKNILLQSDIKKASGKEYASLTTEEKFNPKKTNQHKKIFKDKAYIDVKGWATGPKKYATDKTEDSKSMRYFVNKQLSIKDKTNKLWTSIKALMDEDADSLGDDLINIILKINLKSEIESKKLKGKDFVFALMTGVGSISAKGIVTIGTGSVYPLKTTLCGLDRLGFLKGPKYTVTKFDEANAKAVAIKNNEAVDSRVDNKAAKIFYQLNANLKKGVTPLIDLEIRYKGSFTPQPQFQGNMTPELKKAIIAECEQ